MDQDVAVWRERGRRRRRRRSATGIVRIWLCAAIGAVLLIQQFGRLAVLPLVVLVVARLPAATGIGVIGTLQLERRLFAKDELHAEQLQPLRRHALSELGRLSTLFWWRPG